MATEPLVESLVEYAAGVVQSAVELTNLPGVTQDDYDIAAMLVRGAAKIKEGADLIQQARERLVARILK